MTLLDFLAEIPNGHNSYTCTYGSEEDMDFGEDNLREGKYLMLGEGEYNDSDSIEIASNWDGPHWLNRKIIEVDAYTAPEESYPIINICIEYKDGDETYWTPDTLCPPLNINI